MAAACFAAGVGGGVAGAASADAAKAKQSDNNSEQRDMPFLRLEWV
jgi:hypothetical protein